MNKTGKQLRIEKANEVIRIIASHGRKFFSHNSEIGHFVANERGQLFFVDSYTKKPVYVQYRGDWIGFTEGGTLRTLVEMLRDYITGKREDIAMGCFGPWPAWYCDGDPWGYGAEMERVRLEIGLEIRK
jgi:hypothetical protein